MGKLLRLLKSSCLVGCLLSSSNLLAMPLFTYLQPLKPQFVPQQSEITKTLDDWASGKTAYKEREKQELKVHKNLYGITFFNPTYILPFYYTRDPCYEIYREIPDNQKLRKLEFTAQLSFKFPIWHNVLNSNYDLYAAYTQINYWQVYINSPYFRETNYAPELFFEHRFQPWLVSRFGAVHQSNGRGGLMERSWDRFYAEMIFPLGNWIISLKPWVLVFTAESSDLHNPDITAYIGHGRLLIAYKYKNHTFSFMSRNNFESAFKRGAQQFTWSFPIHGQFKGYVQVFHGYGQSLIEYDHRTLSGGVGVALNDWL